MTLNDASYIGFDLETVRLPPKRQFDDTTPLNVGISCASLAYSEHDVKVWQGTPSLTVEQCQDVVAELERINNTAKRVVTWNGSGFDYRVLAEESQLRERCIDLMIHHIQEIRWIAKSSGKPQRLQTPLLSVKQCMELPLPDLSWMNPDKKKPVSRQEFLAWAFKE